jgi:tetratricopeptide (TPR) repeat protein
LINLSAVLYFARLYDEALEVSRRVLLLNPSLTNAHAFAAYELVYLGRLEDALATALAEPDEPWRLMTLPIVFWAMGRKADSDAALRVLKAKYAAEGSYNIVAMHAYRGEIDAAFQWLERAYRQHDGGMTWLRLDPLLQNLRHDPRYRAMLISMKLNGEPPKVSD